MLFHKRVNLKSNLPISDLRTNLQKITENHHTNSKKGFLFEGKIHENNFTIYPTFDYGPNEQLRPEIKGHIKANGNHTLIELTYQLSSGMSALLIAALLLNLGIMCFLMINPVDPYIFRWETFAAFIPITGLIFWLYFFFKVDKCTIYLKKVLKATTVRPSAT